MCVVRGEAMNRDGGKNVYRKSNGSFYKPQKHG